MSNSSIIADYLLAERQRNRISMKLWSERGYWQAVRLPPGISGWTELDDGLLASICARLLDICGDVRLAMPENFGHRQTVAAFDDEGRQVAVITVER